MSGNTTRVAVIGADGKMGTACVHAVTNAPDLELATTITYGDPLTKLTDAGVDVAIEFTVPDSAPTNVAYCIDNDIHCVVGTTGWDNPRLADVQTRLNDHPSVGVLIAPNFAIGAVLAMRFAEMAAPYFTSAEVIELHHPHKLDAPSGTATHTAKGIAAARARSGCAPMPDATETDPGGARGASIDGVNVHAVRLQGLVAHEEIVMGNTGEMLTVRHDSFDRVSFMGGVLLGVRTVSTRPGLAVGLDQYMDLG